MVDMRKEIYEELVKQLMPGTSLIKLSELRHNVDQALRNGKHIADFSNNVGIFDELVWDLIVKRAITPVTSNPSDLKEPEIFVSNPKKLI